MAEEALVVGILIAWAGRWADVPFGGSVVRALCREGLKVILPPDKIHDSGGACVSAPISSVESYGQRATFCNGCRGSLER